MYIGIAAFNLATSLDTVHLLNAYIHEDYLWIKHGHLSQGFRSITCFSDHCKIWLYLKCSTQSQACYLGIVNDHNACFCHTILWSVVEVYTPIVSTFIMHVFIIQPS